MKVKPLSDRTVLILCAPFMLVYAPFVTLVVGVAFVWCWVERKLDPPGWRRVFALWPVVCDPWPDEGYAGWVWLETVWRNPSPPGFCKHRRERPAPTPESPETKP